MSKKIKKTEKSSKRIHNVVFSLKRQENRRKRSMGLRTEMEKGIMR